MAAPCCPYSKLATVVVTMSSQYLVSRPARVCPCPRCHRPELIGIDEGIPFRVEPVPVTVMAELTARMNGRRTYSVSRRGVVQYRDQFRISGDQCHGRPIVVVQHACYIPVDVSDMDIQSIGTVQRFMADEWVQQVSSKEDQKQSVEYTIWDIMNGRVIDETSEPAPF